MNLLKVRHHHHEGSELHGEYPQPWVLRRTYRFLLGRPMDNRIYTDATFWRSATRGYPGSWLRLAGWQRLTLRLAAIYGALLFSACSALYLLEADGALLELLLWHVLLGVLLAGPVVLRRTISAYGLSVPVWEKAENSRRWVLREIAVGSRGWEREVVRPLARALAPQLNRAYHPDLAAGWVSVPRDYRKEDGPAVEIRLPESFVPDPRVMTRLVRTASARLAVHGMHAAWELENTSTPRLFLTSPIAPPAKVDFSGVRHFLENSQEYRPFLGMAGGSEGFHAEMIEDAAHIALSAGPGAGKSVLASVVAAQALRWGWGVVILDWKQSHVFKWMAGLPGVTYISDLEAIHDFGVRIAEEVDIRKTQGMTGRAKVLVIRDEWNVTADLLMAYWQDLRATSEEKATMPLRSPALRGFAVLDFAGREFGLHDFCIAQRFSARVFNGNADIRECFGIRLLARYSPQTKKMLVGDIKPFPLKNNTPGRWVVVAGEEVSEIQVPLCTDDELRMLASGGRDNPSTPLSSAYRPEVQTPRPSDTEIVVTLGDQVGSDPTPAIAARPVGALLLAEIVPALTRFGYTLEILKNERKRDPEFPGSVGGNANAGYLYIPAEVAEWAARRHARMSAEKVAK